MEYKLTIQNKVGTITSNIKNREEVLAKIQQCISNNESFTIGGENTIIIAKDLLSQSIISCTEKSAFERTTPKHTKDSPLTRV